jgi:hypothetical protein
MLIRFCATCFQRKVNPDARPLSRLGFKCEAPFDQADSFLNAQQAQPTPSFGLKNYLWPEGATVIMDFHANLAVRFLDQNGSPAGSRVAHHVGQPLLRDAIQDCFLLDPSSRMGCNPTRRSESLSFL